MERWKLKQVQKFIWNEEAELAFKNVLHQLPCLETTIFINHASNFAVGGVLTQGEGDEELVST